MTKKELQNTIEWLEETWYETQFMYTFEDRNTINRDKAEEDFYYDQLDKKGYKDAEINKVMKELGYYGY